MKTPTAHQEAEDRLRTAMNAAFALQTSGPYVKKEDLKLLFDLVDALRITCTVLGEQLTKSDTLCEELQDELASKFTDTLDRIDESQLEFPLVPSDGC